MPTLTVSRDRGWADKLRSYRVVVDGQAIGTLGQDEVLRHEIAPGDHTIEAKIDWCSSGPVGFKVDGDVEIEVQSALRGARLFLGLPIIFGARKKYLKIQVK